MNLGKDSRRFAEELSDLLNKTVTTGIRLSSVLIRGVAHVGYRIGVDDIETKGIPVRVDDGPIGGYLGVSYRLAPDDEGEHLMVKSSVVGIFADEALDEALIHYDYERHKLHGYPEAHMQISAESPAWKKLRGKGSQKPLEKLHFPVGGRRYRPSIEEVIEFLVIAVGVDARTNWKKAVDEGRARFEERQFRAAVRRRPEWAFEQLKRDGHLVSGAGPGALNWVP